MYIYTYQSAMAGQARLSYIFSLARSPWRAIHSARKFKRPRLLHYVRLYSMAPLEVCSGSCSGGICCTVIIGTVILRPPDFCPKQ